MGGEKIGVDGIAVRLDPAGLRSCMSLWRDTVDVKIPMKDDFKIHFIAKRREILSNYERTASAWLMVLRYVRAEGGGRAEFEALVREIGEFCEWAKAGIAEFERLGKEG